jgi:predicted nuclease of restriction endonuclease-like (RecB) superfamily
VRQSPNNSESYRLAKDLGTEFPGVEGFSLRNLRYMRSFAEAWPDPQILQQAAKLPWGHHMVLLDRLKDGLSREWYLRASIERGWSRNVLTRHISTQLREREGKALTTFSRTLPAEDSDLTQQMRSRFGRARKTAEMSGFGRLTSSAATGQRASVANASAQS